MLAYKNKPQWLPDWAWRAWRTFLQVLLPSVSAILATYATTQEISLEVIYFTAIIPAVSAAIAAVSNLVKEEDDYLPTSPEITN